MNIIFIRHGQTNYNKEERAQGQEIDLSLNKIGVNQVKKAIKYLPESIDLIISSPLKRAVETAYLINKKYNKNILLIDDIKEISYGSLAGKTDLEIKKIMFNKNTKRINISSSFQFHPYGGESLNDVKKRVKVFLNYIKKNYLNKKIVVVTHGGIIEVTQLLLSDMETPQAKNTGIYSFNY